MATHEEIDVIVKPTENEGQDVDAIIHLEIELEGREEPISLAIIGGDTFLAVIREKVGLAADDHIFERDKDDPLTGPVCNRKAIRLVGHRARQIAVEVRYEHLTKQHHFAPSKTVFRVLQWAIGKHGFNLDPVAAAKANLILPGADTPLPRDAVIGKFPRPSEKLVLDLTLRDFTNGSR